MVIQYTVIRSPFLRIRFARSLLMLAMAGFGTMLSHGEGRILFVCDKESAAGFSDIHSLRGRWHGPSKTDSKRESLRVGAGRFPPTARMSHTSIDARKKTLCSSDRSTFLVLHFIPDPGFTGKAIAVQWQGNDKLVFTEGIVGEGLPQFDFTRIDAVGGLVDPFIGGTYTSFATGIDSFQVHTPSETNVFHSIRAKLHT